MFDLLCVLSVSCYWKKILLLLMFTRVLCCQKQPSVPLGQHVMTQLNQSICLKLYSIALLLCFCTFGTTQQKSGIKLLLTLIILILYVNAYCNVNKTLLTSRKDVQLSGRLHSLTTRSSASRTTSLWSIECTDNALCTATPFRSFSSLSNIFEIISLSKRQCKLV